VTLDIVGSQPFERSLPNSAEAERAILGAILLDNGLIAQAAEVLQPEDFYIPSHRRIFVAMMALFQKGAEINPILIGEELKKENALESVGGISFITNLTYGLPHSTNVAHYAKVVIGKSYLRNLIKKANAITQDALAEEDEPEVIGERAEQGIFSLRDSRTSRGKFEGVKLIAEGLLATIEEQSGKGAVVSGLTTGFVDLDRLTSGLQNSDLIILAARPSVGKTSFALMLAENAALLAGAVVGVFSLESSKRSLVTRMIAHQSRVDARRLRNGFLSRLEWAEIAKALGVLSEAKISIDDTPGMNILEMRAKARRLATEQKKLDLIIVDYLQLMRGTKGKYQSENLELTEISHDLKGLAKEMDCPLIALSQLSRKPEDRSDHTPQLADLRGSGTIEQDADVVAFLHRPDRYMTAIQREALAEEEKNRCDLIIAKQREGPTEVVSLRWTPGSMRFDNLYQETANLSYAQERGEVAPPIDFNE
jgi:replicative DNA helicase